MSGTVTSHIFPVVHNNGVASNSRKQTEPSRSWQEYQNPSLLSFSIKRFDTLSRIQPASSHPQAYKILWITGGEGRDASTDIEQPVGPATLLFLGPDQLRYIKASSSLSGFLIEFTDEYILAEPSGSRAMMSPFFTHGVRYPALKLAPPEIEYVSQIISNLEREYITQLPGREKMLQGYLHILLIFAARLALQHICPSAIPASPLIQTFLALVEQHFRHKKQVCEYAAYLSVTPGYLNDLTKQVLGKTVSEVIHERILLEAKRLLLHSDAPISEIANQLNFDDPSYFTRFFRRYIRQTPHAFRLAGRMS